MTPQKPKIFISSTIYDFHDLRSAIKFYLESLGYEVLLSEYNDFTKGLDENSYKACLKAIGTADYFILLIGSRVGGFYNKNNRESITQREYREVYELVKKKSLRIITFVRKEVWDVREDREALRDYLAREFQKKYEMSDADVAKVCKHKSKLLNDARFTFDFLDEVSRNKDTKKAIEGEETFPEGNWIHPFTRFEDIVDALQAEFNFAENLARIAIRINLSREILENLTLLTTKLNTTIFPGTVWARDARRYYKGNLNSMSSIPRKYLHELAIYCLIGFKHSGSTQFLDQALSSGEFLEYDVSTNTYKSGLINDSLFKLKNNITHLQKLTEIFEKDRMDFVTRYKDLAETEQPMKVKNIDLILPFSILDRHDDVIKLSIGLIKVLGHGGNLEYLRNLKLNLKSPVEGMSEQIEEETPTIDELRQWIDETHSKNRVGA